MLLLHGGGGVALALISSRLLSFVGESPPQRRLGSVCVADGTTAGHRKL